MPIQHIFNQFPLYIKNVSYFNAVKQGMQANLIGERVKQARREKNPKITQIALAAMLQSEGLSIDQTQLSKIENGTRTVTDIELAAIAKVLNVSASWLLHETDLPVRP